MKMQRMLVWIFSVTYLAFGLSFILLPEALALYFTGGSPQTPSGVIDMRATYGGLSLGAGVWLAYCALRQDLLRFGVLGGALLTGGLGVGRTVGLVMDGDANQFMYIFLGIEIAAVGISAMALAKGADAA